MPSIKERLINAEESFLSALSGGEEALLSFESQWQTLMEEVDAASDSFCLDPDTSSLVHTTALRIATLADTSVALFTSYDDLTSQLVGELDELLSGLTIADHSTPPARSILPSSPSNQKISVEDNHKRVDRKRRRDSFEATECQTGKRRRHSSITTSSPSPSKCAMESPSLPVTELCHTALIQKPVDEPLMRPIAKRKRCASDSDTSSQSYRPKRFCAGPRLHAASDTYTIKQVTALRSGSFLPSTPPVSSAVDVVDRSQQAVEARPCPTSEASSADNSAPPVESLYLDYLTPPFQFPDDRGLAESHPDSATESVQNGLDDFLAALFGPVGPFALSTEESCVAHTASATSQYSLLGDHPSTPSSTRSQASTPSSTPPFPSTPLLDPLFDLQTPVCCFDLTGNSSLSECGSFLAPSSDPQSTPSYDPVYSWFKLSDIVGGSLEMSERTFFPEIESYSWLRPPTPQSRPLPVSNDR